MSIKSICSEFKREVAFEKIFPDIFSIISPAGEHQA